MTTAKAFLAGFLSTLVFHQGALAIIHGAGVQAVGDGSRPAARNPIRAVARFLGRPLGSRAVADDSRRLGTASLAWRDPPRGDPAHARRASRRLPSQGPAHRRRLEARPHRRRAASEWRMGIRRRAPHEDDGRRAGALNPGWTTSRLEGSRDPRARRRYASRG